MIYTTTWLGVSSLCIQDEIVALHFPYPETFIFIDPYCLDEQMTSTADTPRSPIFRSDIMARDGESCIVTGVDESHCDAAHLMPKCKSDEVPFMIILCGFSMMLCTSTLRKLSKIVLPFMGHNLRSLALMMS